MRMKGARFPSGHQLRFPRTNMPFVSLLKSPCVVDERKPLGPRLLDRGGQTLDAVLSSWHLELVQNFGSLESVAAMERRRNLEILSWRRRLL